MEAPQPVENGQTADGEFFDPDAHHLLWRGQLELGGILHVGPAAGSIDVVNFLEMARKAGRLDRVLAGCAYEDCVGGLIMQEVIRRTYFDGRRVLRFHDVETGLGPVYCLYPWLAWEKHSCSTWQDFQVEERHLRFLSDQVET
jgi:hypothetical protein